MTFCSALAECVCNLQKPSSRMAVSALQQLLVQDIVAYSSDTDVIELSAWLSNSEQKANDTQNTRTARKAIMDTSMQQFMHYIDSMATGTDSVTP